MFQVFGKVDFNGICQGSRIDFYTVRTLSKHLFYRQRIVEKLSAMTVGKEGFDLFSVTINLVWDTVGFIINQGKTSVLFLDETVNDTL